MNGPRGLSEWVKIIPGAPKFAHAIARVIERREGTTVVEVERMRRGGSRKTVIEVKNEFITRY